MSQVISSHFICIHTFNGIDYISLADETTFSSYQKRQQPQLGERCFVQISQEEFDLGLDAIIKIITKAKSPEAKPHGPSNQEGEVANAKALFKKLTGKDFIA